MSIRFAKCVAHARPPQKLNVADPGMTVFSAENFKVEYGEVHAYRTGIVVEIPDGKIGVLHETNGMGIKGVTVAGSILTHKDIGEVRVNLINSHREAFEVKAGDPIAYLLIQDAPEEDHGDAEEFDLEGLTFEMKDRLAESLDDTRKAKAAQAADEANAKSGKSQGVKASK